MREAPTIVIVTDDEPLEGVKLDSAMAELLLDGEATDGTTDRDDLT